MVYEQSDLYSVLPENTRYQDDGCSLFYSCLSCPFPCCVYDLPGGDTKLFKQYRYREIIRLAGEGVKTKELATFFKVTQRCVEQVLRNSSCQKINKRKRSKSSRISQLQRPYDRRKLV